MQIDDIVDLAKGIRSALARKVVESTGVGIEYEWEKHNAENFSALLGILKNDRNADFELVSEKFETIDALRAEPKNKKLMQEFLKEEGLLPESAEGLTDEQKAEMNVVLKYTTAQIAAFCVSVLKPDRIQALRDRAYVNERNGNGWKQYDLELHAAIADGAVKSAENALMQNLRSYVHTKEHCAEHAVPLTFNVGDKQVFVLKLDDRPVDIEVWKDEANDFAFVEQCQSVKLAVVLDRKNSRVGINYRKGKKGNDIARIFCDTVLGEGMYDIKGEVSYDLSYFAKHGKSNLGNSKNNKVRNVTVIELHVHLAGSRDSKRVFAEQKKDLYETIRAQSRFDMVEIPEEYAESVFPIGTSVKRVKLRVEYDSERRLGDHKMFEFSDATAVGAMEAPKEVWDSLLQLLQDKKIAKRVGVRKNDKSSGSGDSEGN